MLRMIMRKKMMKNNVVLLICEDNETILKRIFKCVCLRILP